MARPEAESASLACDTCRGLFMSDIVPQVYLDKAIARSNAAMSSWHRTAQQLQSSTAAGCSLCIALERVFQGGYLRSKLYKDTGDIKLVVVHLPMGSKFVIAFYLGHEDGEQCYDWLTFQLAAASDDDPSARIVPGTPLQRFKPSQAHFDTVRGWMRDCDSHPRCRDSSLPHLPYRVIDVALGNDVANARLVLANGTRDRYAALSYCWGRSNFCTTRSNLLALEQRLPVLQLPRTLRDAIECARRIGLRYLWVDALCIVQDDEDEKAREMARMAHIYRDADVTVSAALAADSAEGFLHERACVPAVDDAGDAIPYLPFRCGDGGEDNVGIVGLLKFSQTSFRDPIVRRGWTFQETMLSRRLLVYGTLGVYWQCLERRVPDDVEEGAAAGRLSSGWLWRTKQRLLGSARPASDSEKDVSQREWEQIVEEYSTRALSFPRDKLPALSAVASTCSEWCPGPYVAGVWEPWLARLLLWRSPAPEQAARLRDIAPSWSWASLSGAVAFVTNGYELYYDSRSIGIRAGQTNVFREQIEILACNATPMFSSAPYGEVTATRLAVRGRLKACPLSASDMLAQRRNHGGGRNPGIWAEPYAGFYPDSQAEMGDINQPLLMMPVAVVGRYTVGLLLHGERPNLRRCGMYVEAIPAPSTTVLTIADPEDVELL